jgi:diguanylate cyclase (GGDEF)-like protein
VILENARKDKRFDPSLEEITGTKTRSMLCIPLIYANDLVGIIQLINRSADITYSETDLETVSGFADYAALAIANWRLQKRNEELSIRDPLTGLFNTKFLDSNMDKEIDRASRYDDPLSFLMIDVDSYYDLCERLGREAGTELVRDVSRLLRENLRSVDIIARYTADRFAALLPSIASKEALVVAHRLREDVARHSFLSTIASDEKITVSIGLASYPQDADSKNELMSMAHLALDVAKKEGKNRVITAESIPEEERVTAPENQEEVVKAKAKK